MTSENLGRELYDRGWRQGTTFAGHVSQRVVSSLDPFETREVVVHGEGLVLSTQDCDLVKAPATVPTLEAIPFIIDPERAKSTKSNNSRFFVLEPENHVVADRSRRVPMMREALATLPAPTGLPCAGDARRARQFAKWMASAYDRPALPDELNPNLVTPINREFTTACRPGGSHEWLNAHLHEIRVAGRFTTEPPWPVALLFVLADEAPVSDCEVAIAELLHSSGVLDERDGPVRVEHWSTGTLATISVLDYSAAFPVSLEAVSYGGGEEIGATPLRADPA
jgi:hypothetical protein